MKISLLFILLTCTSTSSVIEGYNVREFSYQESEEIQTIQYDGCEYVLVKGIGSGVVSITHKGNCKNHLKNGKDSSTQ